MENEDIIKEYFFRCIQENILECIQSDRYLLDNTIEVLNKSKQILQRFEHVCLREWGIKLRREASQRQNGFDDIAHLNWCSVCNLTYCIFE